MQETGSVYRPQLPSRNAFDYYLEAGRALSGGKEYTGQQPPPLAERQWVERNQRAYNLLREGTSRPYRLPDSFTESALSGPRLPSGGWRSLARLLNARIRRAIALHDGQDAVRDWQVGFKFVRDIQGDSLLGMLSGLACESALHAPVIREMDYFSAHECRLMAQTLAESERAPDRLNTVVEGEMRIAQRSLEELLARAPKEVIPILRELLPSGSDDAGGQENPIARALEQQLRTPEGYAQFVARLRQQLARQMRWFNEAFALKGGRFQRTAEPEPRDPAEAVAQMLAPTGAQAAQVYWENRARRRLMLIHLRLRAYRLAEGRYPPTLDALQLKELAIDPFSGEPFIYRLQGERYVLYSVGAAGRDLGGRRRQPNAPANLFLTRDGWR